MNKQFNPRNASRSEKLAFVNGLISGKRSLSELRKESNSIRVVMFRTDDDGNRWYHQYEKPGIEWSEAEEQKKCSKYDEVITIKPKPIPKH